MNKKSFVQPRSFFELVVASFALVTVPLIIALVSGAYFVGRLYDQSQEAVYRAVLATQAGRDLLEQATLMERSVRQFAVLGDPELLAGYHRAREAFEDSGLRLRLLLRDTALQAQLEALLGHEREVARSLEAAGDAETAARLQAGFITLTAQTQELFRDTNRLIESEVEVLREMAAEARNVITWELMALGPGVVIFFIVFTILIARPVRQVEQAIQRIGDGDFITPVKVQGPRNMEALGERLDWLRGRLVELESRKRKFLSYVSHELKTPLTAIRESADLLEEGVLGPMSAEQREVVEILRKNSLQLQTMIEKLLSFNLPEVRERPLQRREVNLCELLESVLADHKPAILAKHLELRQDCREVRYPGDEERLRVILDNLISNAVKYTPDGGVVAVSLHRRASEVELRVRDSGPGIPPESREQIFEAFYRGSHPDHERIKGSGLGLAIVREFVRAHGGHISVEDAAPGALFRVSLPFPEGDA